MQSFFNLDVKSSQFREIMIADPVPDKTSKQVEVRFEVSLNLQV